MGCEQNPPTVILDLSFPMYQAAKMDGHFPFVEESDDPIRGVVVTKLHDRIEIEAYPMHLLDLVQTYIDLIDRNLAHRASWAAIRRISAAMLDWMHS